MPDPAVILVLVLGLSIAAGLMWIALRALCGDRFRGTPRCPRCWHDQTGVPTLTCPECGFAMRSERDRERTRRHWIPATLAVLALAGGAIALRTRFTGESVWAFLPTRVLVAILPWTEGGPVPELPQIELLYRIGTDGIAPVAADAIVDRMLAGDADAPLGSDAWESRYGRYSWELFTAATSRGENRLSGWDGWKRLADLPPRLSLERATWPEPGGPIVVELDANGWWPGGWQARIAIDDPASDADPAPIGFDPNASGTPVHVVTLAPARPDERLRTVRLAVDRRERDADGSWGPWTPRWSFDLEVPLPERPALAADRPRTAFDTPEMAAPLRRAFDDGFITWERGDRRHGFRFDPGQTMGELFEGVLIGLEVEVLEGDAVRRRSRIWWPGGPRGSMRGWGSRWEILAEDRDALDRLPRVAGEVAGWSVRIRGEREIAWRALAAPGVDPARIRGYWAGTLRFPLSVRPSIGEAPQRRFFPPDP
jgi:hypothetical protein